MPALRSGTRRLRSSGRGSSGTLAPAARSTTSSNKLRSRPSREAASSTSRNIIRKAVSYQEENEEESDEEEESDSGESEPASRVLRSRRPSGLSADRPEGQRRSLRSRPSDINTTKRRPERQKEIVRTRSTSPLRTLRASAPKKKIPTVTPKDSPIPLRSSSRNLGGREIERNRKRAASTSEESHTGDSEVVSISKGRNLRSRNSLPALRSSLRQNGKLATSRYGPPNRRRSARFVSSEEDEPTHEFTRLTRQRATSLSSRPIARRRLAIDAESDSEEENEDEEDEIERDEDEEDEDEEDFNDQTFVRRTRASQGSLSNKVKSARTPRSSRRVTRPPRQASSRSGLPQREKSTRVTSRRDRLNIVDIMPDEDEDEDEDDLILIDQDDSEDDVGGDEEEDTPTQRRSSRPSVRQKRLVGRRVLEILDTSSDSSSSQYEDARDEDTQSGYSSWTDEDIPIATAIDTETGVNDLLEAVDLPPLSAVEQELLATLSSGETAPSRSSRTIISSSGRRVTKRRRLGFDISDSEEEELRGRRRRSPAKNVPSSSSSDGATDDDSEVERLANPQKESALQRHWDTCGRCSERPAWMEIISLKRMQSRLDAKRSEQLRQSRPNRKEMKGRRSTGHYDEGLFEELHAFGSAQTQLDEKRRAVEERGAWLVCSTCSVSMHTGCQWEQRTKEVLHKINVESAARHKAYRLPGKAKLGLEFSPADYVTGVQCENCYGIISQCHICQENCTTEKPPSEGGDGGADGRLFRCKRCFRPAHYRCLQQLSGEDEIEETALARQSAGWKCIDCEAWGQVEKILAWRPQADSRPEPASHFRLLRKPGDDLKRDYLVKFKNTSFRETQWVPHHWLALVAETQLRNFLAHGTRLELETSQEVSLHAPGASHLAPATTASLEASQDASSTPRRSKRHRLLLTASRETGEVLRGPPAPEADAQERIPKTWMTPDRILDIYFHVDTIDEDNLKQVTKAELRKLRRRPRQITKAGHGADISLVKDQLERSSDYVHISQVDDYFLEGIDEADLQDLLPRAHILVKWDDLEYEQSTWENGARPREYGHEWLSIVLAFQRYLSSRKVYVKHLSERQIQALEVQREKTKFQSIAEQPDYIVGGQMLDFQLDGLNWLRYGWHDHQPGILADEMGLGKTVQLVAFIASLHQQFNNLAPYLVVVPNSVVTNWVREFEKWCPHLRVVPYYGGRESRGIIERFELFHLESQPGRQDLRAEVVICSETTARLDPAPLKRVQRWQALIVDEGTNLKAGSSILLYRRLSALNTAHRVIMTGTPLNNNIGELFNLLNWLKPNAEWKDVKGLHRKYAVLTPELIAELQPLLKPYFLRRLKKDVIDLPPRSEVLVPISLTPLQKRVYKDVLEKNIEDIKALTDVRSLSKREHKYKIGNLMNILLQLRKVCQHPYLIAPSLETFEGDEGHDWRLEARRLVEASSKLQVLQLLLPQLKAKGRRVLIFSQFVIFLDIVESFLLNEGNYKYLRLDGSFSHRQRQRGIAAFNAPGSEYFCYLLSTRAGGVGINLASADTVIILDSDFNPHMDMQAIARAHRIGQSRKVIVFTLVAKSTAEEQIVNNARKKLLLDHVIHTMDDEESRSDSLEGALHFGARALFQEGGVDASDKDVRLTKQDVRDLIEEAEQAADVSATAGSQGVDGNLLSFARVWEQDEQADPTADMAEDGFWTALLAKTRATQPNGESGPDGQGEPVIYGRGGARRAKLIALAGGASAEVLAEEETDASSTQAEAGSRPQPLTAIDGHDIGGDDDWTLDLSVHDPSTATEEGVTSLDDDERLMLAPQSQPVNPPSGRPRQEGIPPASASQPAGFQPIKRPRGRPRKEGNPSDSQTIKRPRGRPRKEGAIPAAAPQAITTPSPPPSTAANFGVFASTSRSLPRLPKQPKEPRAKKSRRADGQSSGTNADATNPGGNIASNEPIRPMTIYSRLASVRDPAEAMALCVAAFPGQPDMINKTHNAWVGVMLGASAIRPTLAPDAAASLPNGLVQANDPGSRVQDGGRPRQSLQGPGSAAMRQIAANPASSLVPGRSVQQHENPHNAVPGHASSDTRSSTSQHDVPSAPARGKGRPKGVTTAAPGSRQLVPVPSGATPLRPPPPPAAAPKPGIAGFQQPGQPPLAQQPSILEQQPASGFMDIRRTPAELRKLFKDLPESFMADVKLRHAQGAPKSLLIPEQRSQLTKTHMAYFSLRLLNFLGGIHPLFNDAFTLVQSEHVPSRIRAQPFEGAEMLSISVVTERLIETAHYFYEQLQNQGKKRRGGGGESGGTGPRSVTTTAPMDSQSGPSSERSQKARAPRTSTMSVDHVLNGDASMGGFSSMGEDQRGVGAQSQEFSSFEQHHVQRDRGMMPPPAPNVRRNPTQSRSGPTFSHRTAADVTSSDGHTGGAALSNLRSDPSSSSITTISPTALPPETSSQSERLAFFWLQAIDSLNLAGMSKASRMWLLQPIGPERDVMGQEINERLAEILNSRRRLGQPIPLFFRGNNAGGGGASDHNGGAASWSGGSSSSSSGGGGGGGGGGHSYADDHLQGRHHSHGSGQKTTDLFGNTSYERRISFSAPSPHNAGWPGGM